MTRRAAGAASVHAVATEQVTIPQSGALKGPMGGVGHLVRGSGHHAGAGEAHAEQRCFRFDQHAEPALQALTIRVENSSVTVKYDHRLAVRVVDGAVDAVAAEVHEAPPSADPITHA